MAFFCTMNTDVRSFSISGYGWFVVTWMVYLSMIFLLMIALVYTSNLPGLLTMVAGRSSDHAMSSVVSSVPSCHFTPLRRWNSHVRLLTSFHDSARPGTTLLSGSSLISVSNTCSDTLMFENRL